MVYEELESVGDNGSSITNAADELPSTQYRIQDSHREPCSRKGIQTRAFRQAEALISLRNLEKLSM